MSQIQTEIADLKLEDIPLPTADISEIFSFAHSINGYEVTGSFEETASIANNPDPNSLFELRIALFFSARAFRHVGLHEDCPEMRQLVAQIRDCLRKEMK